MNAGDVGKIEYKDDDKLRSDLKSVLRHLLHLKSQQNE